MSLTTTQQALLRGWIQGIAWDALGQLYLDGAARPEVLSAVRELRSALALKAHRLGLDIHAQLWDRDRDYQADWQRQALVSLEDLVAQPDPIPRPSDGLDRWFPNRLVGRLAALECGTLGELAGAINARGESWWRQIPRLGRHSADAVHAFFRDWREALGLSLDLSRRPPAGTLQTRSSGVAPLERLFLPEHLDGAAGSNRAPEHRCRIDARDDLQAIQSWLSLLDPTSATYRSYRKEAERFLLWALLEKGKPLSSLTTPDCAEYRRFLADPTPASRWIGQVAPRWSSDWRPFKGPLQPSSIGLAEVVLSALCAWLVGQRYLDSNPFAGLGRQGRIRRQGTDRILPLKLWETVLAYVQRRILAEEQDGGRIQAYRRTAFILELAYATGLRAHELAQARVGDLRRVASSGGDQWWLDVIGKGKKHREVPIPPALLAAIDSQLRERRLGRLGTAGADTALIGKLRGDRSTSMNTSQVFRILKRVFQEVADDLATTDPEAAQRLVRASTHWLRHSHGSHAVDAGVPLAIVRDNLGHANIATTSIYVHTDRDERYRALVKLRR